MSSDSTQTSRSRPSRLALVRSSDRVTRFIKANQLRLCVHERFPSSAPAAGSPMTAQRQQIGTPGTVVLINGLACQLTMWPEALLSGLCARGFRVVCFDNRDIGLSDKVHSRRLVNTRLAFIKALGKLRNEANYTLYDMAEDTSDLIRLLGLRKAHVVGMDMGGGIAQILAARRPDQVASLTLIGTSTNDPQLPMPDIRLLRLINQHAPPAHREQAVIRHWMNFWTTVQSPAYPADTEAMQRLIAANYRRSYCPEGALRQLQAILASGSLRRLLPRIQCPTLILHGEHDPFVHPLGGEDIQRWVKGSRLRVVPGMGHDLPAALCPEFVALITENAGYGKPG